MEGNELDLIGEIAEEFFGRLGVDISFSLKEEGGVVEIDLEGKDPGLLIGFHGETLQALQLILNLIVYRKLGKWRTIVLDVDNWRKKREESLRRLAKTTAERVKFLGEEIELSPMTPFERRIVHLALATDPQVTTESRGEGRERRIVVKLKRK